MQRPSQVRISLIVVRAAVQQCVRTRFPVFNHLQLFVRDNGHGWFDQRRRFAFGRDE
ncbi:MAG: hypothetical protein FD131_4979 [Rhodocyclaceae bacterium]|nr:MAG: hypothetical protein FD131_4979 [Rhodocyclaceae bacterium]